MTDEKSTVLGIRLDTQERKRFDEFVGEEGKNNKDFLHFCRGDSLVVAHNAIQNLTLN